MKRISENLYTLAVVSAPALAVYVFLPGTSLGAFFVLIFSVFFFFTHGLSALSRDNFVLLAVILILTLVETVINIFGGTSWFDYTLLAHNLFSIAICFFPLIIASKGVNVKFLIKGLLIMGLLASLIIIWQRVSLVFTGEFEANVFLPWFEVSREVETFSISRPSAFFTEPAHFCIFILPILYIALLCRNIAYSGLFVFAILCSGSTTGFLVAIIIVSYYIYGKSERKNRIRNVAISILVSALLLVLILAYMPSIILQNLDKLREVDSTSTSLRTVGYLSYFIDFDISETLFGVTLNQLMNYLHYKFGVNEAYNYSNAIIYMLLSYGIFGFLFFVKYLYDLWRRAGASKGLVIVLIAILASDQILFNMHFMYLVTLAMLSTQIASSTVKDINKSKYSPITR